MPPLFDTAKIALFQVEFHEGDTSSEEEQLEAGEAEGAAAEPEPAPA